MQLIKLIKSIIIFDKDKYIKSNYHPDYKY